MSLRKLPKVQAFERPDGMTWEPPSGALSRWAQAPLAAEADEPNTVSIYEPIGEDVFGDGFTARRMAGALRSIGRNPVTVNVNSPGGDFFEGLAIYNLLAEHPARVSVRVMGLAASAASIVAMAGDEVLMGAGSFLMIHNAWALVIGNRHDLGEAAGVLEPFDRAMADIYAARTGIKAAEALEMMDAETWLSASDAIERGFADARIEAPSADAEARASVSPEIQAKRRLEAILAGHGMPRSERRKLIRDLAGTHDAPADGTPRAADSATHDAGGLSGAEISRLIAAMTI